MQVLRIIGLSLAFSALSNGASASDNPWYVGLGIGLAKVNSDSSLVNDDPRTTPLGSLSSWNNSLSSSTTIGRKFGELAAIEAEAGSFTSNIEASYFSLSGLIIIGVTDRIFVFGGPGLAMTSVNKRDGTEFSVEPTASVGIGHRLGKQGSLVFTTRWLPVADTQEFRNILFDDGTEIVRGSALFTTEQTALSYQLGYRYNF